MKNTIKTLIKNILSIEELTSNYSLEEVFLEDNNLYCSIVYKDKNIDIAEKVKQEIISNIKINYPDLIVYISFVLYKHNIDKLSVSNVKKIIAIASGKGGVGKSTITLNLAYSLQQQGYKLAILDADLYGPSIDFMLQGDLLGGHNKNYPIQPYSKNDIKYNSISNFMKNKNEAILLKSPMIIKTFKQMLLETNWGDVDYLLIDLPPGTGDLHIYLTHNFANINVVIVCTSQKVAVLDAVKSINMYHKNKANILGIIENMSSFVCTTCDTSHAIFDSCKIKQVAKENDIEYIGEIPLDISLRIATDEQINLIKTEPNKTISKAFLNISNTISSYLK